jgi:hypothetical protein
MPTANKRGSLPKLDAFELSSKPSIRIHDTFPGGLEQSKQVIANGRGESVSISDVAKTLPRTITWIFERKRQAELMPSPTDSVWRTGGRLRAPGQHRLRENFGHRVACWRGRAPQDCRFRLHRLRQIRWSIFPGVKAGGKQSLSGLSQHPT